MNRRNHIADHANGPDDPVRRDAYERAMVILRGREGLTQEIDAVTVRAYDGPVIVGNVSDLMARR